MIIRRKLGADVGKRPFLTVVTRCYQRPNFLRKNVDSLASQTDADYEHIFVIDETGEGLEAANKALALPEPSGQYVLVLDDDDMFSDSEAIEVMKTAVNNEDSPDLLFFRSHHAELGILPDMYVWQKRPHHGRVGSCDFVSRLDVWQRFISHFGAVESGDFRYLKAVWAAAPRVGWLDRQLTAVQRISRGEPECLPA